MLRLEGRPGNSVELTVLRYQFAGGDNCLIVRGHVETEDGSWSFDDPCLLTSEARGLGSWLRHVTNPLADYERLTFIEPNLAFEVASRTPDTITIHVYFDLEARPAHLADTGEDACWVDAEINPEQLLEASEAWMSELDGFPVRRP